jgi:hypothetical protein
MVVKLGTLKLKYLKRENKYKRIKELKSKGN